MLIFTWCFFIFVSFSFSSSRIYNGSCPNLSMTINPNLFNSPFKGFGLVSQIPLEEYKQEVYIFPTHETQKVSLTIYKTFMTINFQAPNLKNKDLRIGLQFPNENNETILAMFYIKDDTVLFNCRINENIATAVFNTSEAVLIWGCLNLEGSEQHEEALWLFVKEGFKKSTVLAKNGFFDAYKNWAVEKLRSHDSSIPQTDFDFFFHEKKDKYFAPRYVTTDEFRCSAKPNYHTRYIYIIIFAVLLVCIIVVFVCSNKSQK